MNWLQEEELEELRENLNSVETEEQAERFKITDLSTLNWTLRKLSSLDQKRLEEVNLANAELERINMWFAKQDITYQASKNFLEGLIKEYAKSQRVIDPKWKQKTPYGLVSFRKAKKFNYGDEENLVKYLNDNGMAEYVKVVETPKKAELKKALTINKDGKAIFTITGEILPDVTAEEIEDVTIKLEG
jgi:hypothetical protein